jgi:hypothetical protein
MNPRTLPVIAFATGLAAIAWVGFGPLGHSAIALSVVFLIAAAYLAGGAELLRFARSNTSLHAALAELPAAAGLQAWLDQLDSSLRHAVRQRIEGARVALPGPVLTPTLVGLLVLLGMLGTFIGMVVTLDGAVQAMQGSTDVATMRTALTAPVKGLALAFGTSVAGVASSAMLGLTSALLRRDRVRLGQVLDAQVAATLHTLSAEQQRKQERTLQRTEARKQEREQDREQAREHSQHLIAALQGLVAQIDQRDTQAHERLAASQTNVQTEMQAAFAALATSVDQTLTRSLSEAAHAAAAAIQPALASTLQQMAHETAALQQRAGDAVSQQLAGVGQRFEQTVQEVAGQWDQALSALMTRIDHSQAAALAENRQRLETWAGALHAQAEATHAQTAHAHTHWHAQQRSSQEALAQATAAASAGATALARWQDAAANGTQAQQEAAQSVLAAGAQLGGSAVEVSALAEVLLGTVRQFGDANAALVGQLQRIEVALSKSAQRSDEQLAFYVAQARELVDLSIASQQQVTAELQRLAQDTPA